MANSNLNIDESVYSKLMKLYQMYERNTEGAENEALAAKRVMDNLLKKYNLTIEDLISPKEEIKEFCMKYSSDAEKTLIIQCTVNLFGSLSDEFKNLYRYRTGKMQMFIKTTEIKFCLLQDFYMWHISNYKNELARLQANMLQSYLQKFDLFDKDEELRKANGNEAKHRKSKMDSLLDWAYIMTLQAGMKNNSYTKKITKETLQLESV